MDSEDKKNEIKKKLLDNPPVSFNEFVEKLRAGEYDEAISSDLKTRMLDQFEGTIDYNGQKLPKNWTIDPEVGKEIERHVEAVIELSKEHCIPILFVGQIANMMGSGEFTSAAVVPGARASAVMHYLTYCMYSFMGMQGHITEPKLEKEEAQALGNLAKLMYDADTGKMEGASFALYANSYMKTLAGAIKKRMEKFHNEK